MDYKTLTNLLFSIVGMLGLWWLLFKLYADYRIDRFRYEMFCLRDEMFDLAETGTISFQDPAYKLLRRIMNGYIHYVYLANFYEGLYYTFFHDSSKTGEARRFETHLKAAYAKSAPRRQEIYRHYFVRMHKLFIDHVFFYSPEAIAFFLIPLGIRIWLMVTYRNEAESDTVLGNRLTPIDTAALTCNT